MLRLITPLIVICAAFAASPAGAYTRMAARDAAACARACAEDGICMAWTYRAENACELAANVPTAAPADAAAFGLSPRAPAFAQMRALSAPPPPPPQMLAAIEPPPVQTLTPPAPPALESAPTEDGALVLLGGPEEDDLRRQISAPH